jgi:hypothetical protein
MHSSYRLNLLWSSSTSSRLFRPPRPPHHSSLCHPPPAPWSRLTYSSFSPPKTVTPHHLPFPVFISRKWHHSSFTAAASLPLTACFLPPYDSIKGVTKTPSLSIAPTLAPISHPRVRNHLPIRTPSATSIERCRVVISASVAPLVATPTTSLSLRAITTSSRVPEWSRRPMIVSPPWTES